MSLAALAAWVLKHEVLAGWAAVALGAAAILASAYGLGRHRGVESQAPALAAARAEARAAAAQSGIVAIAANAADRAAVRTQTITHRAEEAVHAVQAAPGATDALDPDLLSGWRAGLERLRDDPAAAPVDGSGGGEPAEPVPSRLR